MAALAQLRLGYVVLLRFVTRETCLAFGERPAVVRAFVACAARLVCGLRMQARKLRRLMTRRASGCRAHALCGVNAVAACAALSKIPVVLGSLLRMTGHALCARQFCALVRRVAAETVRVGFGCALVLLCVAGAAGLCRRARCARMRFVTGQTISVFLTRVNLRVAARARARRQRGIVDVALVAA